MNSPQQQSNERTWRDEALDESLRGFGYGENYDGLLYAIRRERPELHTMSFYVNRLHAERFLQDQEGVESLFDSRHLFQNLDSVSIHLQWLRLRWKGVAIEAVFVPDSNETIVCMADDLAVLKEFCESLYEFSLRPEKRAMRYSEGWESAPELDKELGKIRWDDIIIKPSLLSTIRESVETFVESQEILKSFGFPWKRGILLVGPPGTGKTMICKAAATALPDLPFLYVRDFRERNQKESIEAIFKRARKLAPCLLVFEDLDSLINEGNRTVFLNEMDGFASNDGLLIIASSNHPGKIDEALLKRPSRFDRVFHLGLPELAERRAFCEKILTREALAAKLSPDFDVAGLCEQVAAKSDGFTPAYLKEAFVSAALSRAQDGATTLDDRFAAAVLEQLGELKAHLKKVKNPDALAEMRSGDDVVGFRR